MNAQQTSEHQLRNDTQLAMTRKLRPQTWQRMIEQMTDEERQEAEARADRADREGWVK